MGCVNSKKTIFPLEPPLVYPKGVLEVQILNGTLLRDTAVIFKMDPYLILKMGHQTQQSLVQKSEGSSPTFNQKFSFYVNSDKIHTGRWLEISLWDSNIVTDRQIGFGITDVDAVIFNRAYKFMTKCHIGYDMKSAGWVKVCLSFREASKGRLLLKPVTAILKRRVGFGKMNCVVRVIVGEDISDSKISEDTKQQPPTWDDTLSLNLVHSLQKGKLQVLSVNDNSQEIVCEAELDLVKLSSREEREFQLELRHKDTFGGTIRLTSWFVPAEESLKPPSMQGEQVSSAIAMNPKIPLQSTSIHQQKIPLQSSVNE